MWIYTQEGFISAVEHFDPKPGAEIVIRARQRNHLVAMLAYAGFGEEAQSKVLCTPENDYPYRAFVSRGVLQTILHEASRRLDYPNFKARCVTTLGPATAFTLGEVWAETRNLENPKEQGARN